MFRSFINIGNSHPVIFSKILFEPPAIIDSDHKLIAAHAEKTVNDSNGPVEKAVRRYDAVRDGI